MKRNHRYADKNMQHANTRPPLYNCSRPLLSMCNLLSLLSPKQLSPWLLKLQLTAYAVSAASRRHCCCKQRRSAFGA
jgi:hypothetical protein